MYWGTSWNIWLPFTQIKKCGQNCLWAFWIFANQPVLKQMWLRIWQESCLLNHAWKTLGSSHSCYPTCYPTFTTPWIASPDSHMKISTKNCQGQLCDLCKIREATPLFWVALIPWERSPVLIVKQTQFGQNLGKEIREICDGHLYFWRHLLEMKTLGKKVRVR